MKKSQMKRKILKKLQEWDGSQLCMRTASEILKVVMDNGMRPTMRWSVDGWNTCDTVIEFDSEARRTKSKSKRK